MDLRRKQPFMTTRTKSSSHYDATIVGYGPTGATLANLLGLCGLKTLVLEREAAAYHLPRAVHFDDEVMRVFQTVGIAEDLAKTIRVNAGMRFVDTDGNLLLDWPRPQEIGPNGWHASYRFHQPDLEDILRKAVERFDNVAVRSRADVSLVKDHGDMAEVQYEDLATGQRCMVRSKYAIGCDGARSLVRRFIGTGMEDLGFHERWLVIDVILKRPKPELRDYSVQYCNPERPATYCRSPGNRRRWEITVLDHEIDNEITKTESIWALLKPWLSPDEAEIERNAVYTFQSAIAEKWRAGRILIAGDAAHLTPPFMGQGMCTGIRDAANLAWKIALCVKDKAPQSLLDTYQSERQPHAREYIETAIRLGALINYTDSSEALRRTFPQNDGSARMESRKPALGDGLAAGCQNHRGHLFPQPRLSDARLMDDVCGYVPVLLTAISQSKEPVMNASGLRILSANSEPDIRLCLEKLGVKAALVRPDRYILGTANTEDELGALLSCGLESPLPTD